MNVAHVVFQIQELSEGEVNVNLSFSGSTDLMNQDAVDLFNRCVQKLNQEIETLQASV